MKLLRLAVETQKWDLAAHVLILGAITARQKHHDRFRNRKEKRLRQEQEKQKQAQPVP